MPAASDRRSAPTPLTYQILLALADEDRHGYGIIKQIEESSGPVPTTGALYLALQRMETDGLIAEARTPATSSDARRRYYKITRKGRRLAEEESHRMAALVATARAKKLLAGNK